LGLKEEETCLTLQEHDDNDDDDDAQCGSYVQFLQATNTNTWICIVL